MSEQLTIVDLMTPDEAKVWYKIKSKHYNPVNQKLASGLPGKSGRYKIHIQGNMYWIFYSLLYTPSRGYKFTTDGQILARREYLEDQGVMMIASDSEPTYIKDHIVILPSGYRQKVRISYCLYEDLNILRFKGRR